jgi:hypothetical protein
MTGPEALGGALLLRVEAEVCGAPPAHSPY